MDVEPLRLMVLLLKHDAYATKNDNDQLHHFCSIRIRTSEIKIFYFKK